MRRFLICACITVAGLVLWRLQARDAHSADRRTETATANRAVPKPTDGDEYGGPEEAVVDGLRVLGTTEPGALVAVHPEDDDELDPARPIARGRADAQGRFSLAVPESVGEARWVVHISLDGFVPLWDIAVAGQPDSFPLSRGTVATHWVMDHDDQPIENARVVVGVAVAQLGFDRVAIRTGADGSARIRMDPGEPLRIEADGYETVYRTFPSLSSRRDLATYILGPAPVIRILVVDEQGVPVANAEVDYGRQDPSEPFDPAVKWAASREAGVNAGNDGRATIPVSLESHYLLQVRRPGSENVEAIVWTAAGQDELKIVLPRPVTVRGRVVPPLSAEIWANDALVGSTLDGGAFEVAGLMPGRVTLSAATRDQREGKVVLDLKSGETRQGVEIRLPPLGPISYLMMRAVDADDNPVEGVEWEPAEQSYLWHRTKETTSGFALEVPPGTAVQLVRPARVVLRTTESAKTVQTVRVRPARRFRIVGPPEGADIFLFHADRDEQDWFHREAPGTPMSWRVSAPGLQGSGSVPAPEDGATVTLALERTATIRGRLIDANGTPARAIVVGHDTAPVNDADGRFEIDDARPGRFEFVAFEYRGSVDWNAPCLVRRTLYLKPGEVRDLGDIAVPRSVKVSGRVLDEKRRPVGGALVILLAAERGEIGRTRSMPGGRFVAQVPKGKRTLAIAEHPDGRMGICLAEPLELVLEPAGRIVLLEWFEPTVLIETPDGTHVAVLHDDSTRLPAGDWVARIIREGVRDGDAAEERRAFTLKPGGSVRLGAR